jgi:hypothetical protein
VKQRSIEFFFSPNPVFNEGRNPTFQIRTGAHCRSRLLAKSGIVATLYLRLTNPGLLDLQTVFCFLLGTHPTNIAPFVYYATCSRGPFIIINMHHMNIHRLIMHR